MSDQTSSSGRLLKKLVIASIAITLLFFGIEFLTYPGALSSKVLVGPIFWGTINIALVIIYRRLHHPTFPQRLKQLGLLSAVGATILSFCLTLLETLNYPNYIFGEFGIYPELVFQLAFFSSCLYATLVFFSRKQKSVLFRCLVPIWLLILTTLFAYNHPQLYTSWRYEDSVIEYTTTMVYLWLFLIGIVNLRIISKRKEKAGYLYWLYAVSHIVLIIGAFLLAGEEVSWGQRVLNIQTPEHLAAVNTQGELNLHNNEAIFGRVYMAYFWLAAYATFSWIVVPIAEWLGTPKQWLALLDYWTPPAWLLGFFLPTMIFVRVRQKYGSVYTDPWEEVIELFLAVGLLVFMYLNFKRIQAKTA